jgi:hypothetical protein
VTLVLAESTTRGFALRLTLLLAATVAVSWTIALGDFSGPLRNLAAGSIAVILALTYVWRPAEALLGTALFMLFSQTYALYLDAPIAPIDEMAVGLIFLIAGVRAAPSWREWMWLPRDVAVLLVLVLAVISSLVAGVPIATWVVALVLLGKSIAFLYAVMWTPFREWEIRGGMWAVAAVAAVVLGLGWIELIDARGFREALGLNHYPSVRSGIPVVKSLFTHPAPYGWLMAFMALFFYAGFVVTRRWRWLLAAVAFGTGTMLSARRRAILGLLAGVGVGVVESFSRLRRPVAVLREWAPVAVSIVLVFALFSPGLIGLYELTIARYVARDVAEVDPVTGELLPEGEGGLSPQARIALYRGSVEIAADHLPLGGGLGRYASWMSRVDYSPLYERYGLSTVKGLEPDNTAFATDTFWPQILGEIGVLGLAAYLAFLGTIALALWREAKRPSGPMLRVLRLGAGMVFAQAIVESLASSMFHSPPRVYLLYLALGVVLSLAWRSRTDELAAEPAAEP